MKNEIVKLRAQYRAAKTEEQRAAIDKQMKELAQSDPDTFGSTMVELARETAQRAQEMLLRERLNDILPAVSVSYIAKNYFGKTRAWLHQRINGSMVNGHPARLNAEECKTLEFALKDIGHKLSSANVSM